MFVLSKDCGGPFGYQNFRWSTFYAVLDALNNSGESILSLLT